MLCRRRPPSIDLSPPLRHIFEHLARSRTQEHRIAERVQIILGCADGKTDVAVASRLGVDPQRVARWRKRFVAAKDQLAAAEADELESVVLGVLSDDPRSGSPGKFDAVQFAQLVVLACDKPEEHGCEGSHWTPRELALCAQREGIVESISPRHVARFFGGGRSEAASVAVLAQPRDHRPAGARRGGHTHLRHLSAGR